MPEPSTLEHVANIIIRRTMSEVQDPQQLMDALSRACPFTDDPRFYEVWLRALERHGIATDGLARSKMRAKREDIDGEKSRETDADPSCTP
jgi:hypothetical protein